MTSFKFVALGLATAIRPTSLAAVGALAATATPRRFLTAYVLAGFAFTIAIGLAAIWLFNGAQISTSTGPVRAFAQVAGGLAAIAFGLLLLSGRAMRPHPEAQPPGVPGRWTATLSEHVSVRRAALAGPATHLPGILYLVAINLIITDERSARLSLVDLLIYNGLWFTVPIAALALSIIRPGSASRAMTAAQPWARKHGRSVVAVICLTLGAVLLVRGISVR